MDYRGKFFDTEQRKKDGGIILLPSCYVSIGEAYSIVKHSLNDDSISDKTKIYAIEQIAELETLNGIKKDELVNALRWIFAHYYFM